MDELEIQGRHVLCLVHDDNIGTEIILQRHVHCHNEVEVGVRYALRFIVRHAEGMVAMYFNVRQA